MSVDFNINSPSQGLTLKPSLSAGQTYQGSNYQWSVSTGGPQGSDSLPAPKPTNYLRFSARGAGVVNQHQTGMVLGNPLNFEIFRFSATGYDPIYNWVFRIHYGDQYEVFGYADISSCECDSCDAVHQKRVFTPCTLGYPDQSTSRAPTIFNEDLILYSYGVTGDFISYYYADEYPLMLGIGYVQDGANAPLETAPGLGPVPTKPICLVDPNLAFGYTSFDPKDKYGALDNSGTGNGCNPNIKPTYTCGRPIPPVLFLTDITDNPASRAGDWQQNGTLYFPNKVCGLFFYTRKIILNPRTQADGTINANILGGTNTPGYSPPPTNTVLKNLLPPWDFGVGADPIPVQAPTNPKTDRFDFGVQIAWDVKKLPLQDARNYRFQIMAHDGDSTKIGGDIGEACVNVIVQCDAGFKNVPGEPPCSTCDVTPLPGDGKWTWFCTPVSDPLPGADSPIANPYNLVKIPVSKLTVDPFKSYIAAGTGFIPKEGQFDKFGFAISCDCKRTVKPCPLNCCGNGKCDYTKGTCTCAQPANQLQNTTTCCPTLAPTNAPTPPPTPAPTPFPFKCPNDCCSRVVCNGNNGQCVCPPPYNAAPYNATDCCLLKTPSPTPQPTPPPLKCPNDCCSRVVCNAANGQCACPPPFNAAPYNSTDCCLLPTPSPTPAPTPAPTTPAPTEFNAPTEAPTPPTQAPTPAPTPAPTDAPCFNNGKYCNGNGICNVTVPVCVCTPPFFGADCSNTTNAPTNAPTPGGPCFNEGKYCNGNGICNETIPACVCTPPFFGVDCSNSTNSPTAVPSPTGPCFNDGKFCSGANGNCVNDTCVCVDARLLLPACEEPPCFNNGTFCSGNGVCTNGTCICDKPEYLQPSCEAPPPPLTQCENITNGTTCLACLLGANAIGINCVFCPQNITLADGSVVQDTENGVCSQTCPGISVATCQPVITVIPPVCPDNCSGVGICVNVTVCDQLRADNIAKYGNDSSTWPLDCGDNANTSRKYNQTGACACYQGYAGLNCALFGAKTLVALAALGAGLIALIVVLAILGAAMAGGGAMAASSGMGQATEAVVTVSPIYEGAGLDGQNPLFSNDYQMMGNG